MHVLLGASSLALTGPARLAAAGSLALSRSVLSSGFASSGVRHVAVEALQASDR